MTAAEFSSLHAGSVVVRWTSVGSPAGVEVFLDEDTELPFDLDEVVGRVVEDGSFRATEVPGGTVDFMRNTVLGVWLRADARDYARLRAESGDGW